MTLTCIKSPDKTIGGKTSYWYAANNPLLWQIEYSGSPSAVPAGYYILVSIKNEAGDSLYSEKFYPDPDNIFWIEISEPLRSLLTLENTFDYDVINKNEPDIQFRFTIKFEGKTDAGETWQDPSPDHYDRFIIHSAKQIGDQWGSNIGDYITLNDDENCKFLTFFSSNANLSWSVITFYPLILF
jgi:hypothetical protein